MTALLARRHRRLVPRVPLWCEKTRENEIGGQTLVIDYVKHVSYVACAATLRRPFYASFIRYHRARQAPRELLRLPGRDRRPGRRLAAENR